MYPVGNIYCLIDFTNWQLFWFMLCLFFQAGGLHIGSEFGNQVGGSMQADRGSSWMSSQPDNSTLTQLQGPSPLVPSQMGPGNQLPRPASVIIKLWVSYKQDYLSIDQPVPLTVWVSFGSLQLTPDMEKALLQQVMSLTPEQINLLPTEQRNQVLQLQQILRQWEGSTSAGHEPYWKTD